MGAGVATNALSTLAPQVVALLALPPAEYATFSLAFIALGLTFSAQLSLVIDPWLRDGAPSSTQPMGPLLWTAAVLAALGSAIPWALGYVDLTGVCLIMAGILVSQIRNGLRLILVALSHWRDAALSDLLFLVGFGAGLTVLREATTWTLVWGPLAVGSLLGVLPWLTSMVAQRRGTVRWFRERRRIIAPLWTESSVLDLGVALPPLTLAELMAPAQFAVVRAATSALLPVRLVLNPMRSWIALREPNATVGIRFALVTALVGAMMGGGIWAGLVVIGSMPFARDSVLPSLAPYAPLVAAMATLQFMSNCLYIVARKHAPARTLLVARLVDTVLQIIVILGGFALAGLGGAISGYVVISATSYAVWWAVIHLTSPKLLARAE